MKNLERDKLMIEVTYHRAIKRVEAEYQSKLENVLIKYHQNRHKLTQNYEAKLSQLEVKA